MSTSNSDLQDLPVSETPSKTATSFPPKRAFGLVFAGGAFGTFVRLGFQLSLNNNLALLWVNIFGAGFLGLINGLASRADNPRFEGTKKSRFASAESKWFWGAGFAGGFTTMSGLALAFVLMVGNFGAIFGLVYILVQFVAGLFAYALGYRIGKGAWPSV